MGEPQNPGDGTTTVEKDAAKELTAALGMLQGQVDIVKAGKPADAKTLGVIMEKVGNARSKYPAPTPKKKKLAAADFDAWAKEELEKVAAEQDPATQVARLAMVQERLEAAQKQLEDGSSEIEIEEIPETIELSPLAAGGQPDTGFSAGGSEFQALQKEVEEIKKKIEKSGDGDDGGDDATSDEDDDSWPLDMNKPGGQSEDILQKWGDEPHTADRDFGPDVTEEPDEAGAGDDDDDTGGDDAGAAQD